MCKRKTAKLSVRIRKVRDEEASTEVGKRIWGVGDEKGERKEERMPNHLSVRIRGNANSGC